MDAWTAVVMNEDTVKVTWDGCPWEDPHYWSREPETWSLSSLERFDDTSLSVEPPWECHLKESWCEIRGPMEKVVE